MLCLTINAMQQHQAQVMAIPIKINRTVNVKWAIVISIIIRYVNIRFTRSIWFACAVHTIIFAFLCLPLKNQPNVTPTPGSPTSRLLLEYEMHLRNTLAKGMDAESYSLHTFEALLSQSMDNLGDLDCNR